MRLLVFTFQFPPAVGGVETMTWHLAKHLEGLGPQVTVLAPSAPAALNFDSNQNFSIKRFDLGDSQTFAAKARQKIGLIKTLRQAIKETKADCLLCTGWDPCGYTACIAELSGSHVPYFLVAHGMELMQLPTAMALRQSKALLRQMTFVRAQRIFAVSEFTRTRVLMLGVAPERLTVQPNGVDDAPNPQSDSTRHRRRDARILMTVSRLVWRKGHDTVISALPRILEQVPDVIYRIVGAGPECSRLQRLSQTLGLEAHVEFRGQVSDQERERLLDECDIFVFPCRQAPNDFEGFGIAVLEAMRHAKPVIVTHAGGVSEIVDDGRTGLIVEPDAPESLATAILALLSDPSRAARIAEAAQMAVRTRYRWDVIAREYLESMTETLGWT